MADDVDHDVEDKYRWEGINANMNKEKATKIIDMVDFSKEDGIDRLLYYQLTDEHYNDDEKQRWADFNDSDEDLFEVANYPLPRASLASKKKNKDYQEPLMLGPASDSDDADDDRGRDGQGENTLSSYALN